LGPCPVALATGDYDDAERYIDALAEQAARHSLSLWQGWAQCLRGVLLIRRDQVEAGLALLRGRYMWPEDSIFVGQCARAMGAVGEIAEGLAAINDAIALAEQRRESWHLAELLRFKGELLLQQAPNDPAGEQHLHRAVELARQQQTLAWELRSAISLANLRRS